MSDNEDGGFYGRAAARLSLDLARVRILALEVCDIAERHTYRVEDRKRIEYLREGISATRFEVAK